jgi:hypothetical protein
MLKAQLLVTTLALPLALAPALARATELPGSFQLAPEVLHLRINGLEVTSRLLTSTLEPTGACAALERQWRAGGMGGQSPRCQRAGKWLLIAHRSGKVLQTAQLQESGEGSDGFLSELDPLAPRVNRAWPQLPLPAGARLVNAVQSTLERDSVTQFTIELPSAPAASLTHLRRLARERGWVSVAGSGASVVDFQRAEVAVRAVALGAPLGCTLVLVEHRPAGPTP